VKLVSNEDQMLKEVSFVPSILSLAILFVLEPLYVVKYHPTTIFPSDWISRVLTVELKPFPIANQVSLVPSVFNLMILFVFVPLYVVNAPPTIIFPSD
jgi:hypothetical protein